jgi:hypothetical protein
MDPNAQKKFKGTFALLLMTNKYFLVAKKVSILRAQVMDISPKATFYLIK